MDHIKIFHIHSGLMVNETPEVMKLQKQSIDIDQQVLKTLMMERQNEICSPGKQWK